MKSVMSHSFSQVPKAEIPRASFNRSHGCKSTFDGGQLIPFFVDEALPGDTFNNKSAGFVRLSTPIYPIMDNMYMDTFFFAVPVRLVWDNFQKMMGEQKNPGDSTDFLVPQMNSNSGHTEGSLPDYMGIPTKVPNLSYNALHFRAYNLIYNEWFRDQNLQDELVVQKDDGPDDPLNYQVKNRGKRHDYFTSALPWPQKGDAVEIPITGNAPVVAAGALPTEMFKATIGGNSNVGVSIGSTTGGITPVNAEFSDALPGSTVDPQTYLEPNMFADMDNVTSATINQLRQAFQIQKMYERDARGGTRYTEVIKSHFGVTSPDARLQRPEYLGGGSTPINITPLASTTDIADVSGGSGRGLASLAAIGTASFNNHGFTKSFTEHTLLIGLVNVRADLTYQQGLNRMFSRRDRLDFFWPALAQIGEQEILNKEIYAQGSQVTENGDDDVFGYQERYAEYRYKPSTIHGQFRSNSDTPLDAWHLSQQFADLPTLSSNFITDQPPIDRVVAVPSEPQFIADFYHRLNCARPMPLFGVPGNMDRF
ncbi:major capsid protein [Microviridae sp.]|nr:major capsid protein [Microviridae sp.]